MTMLCTCCKAEVNAPVFIDSKPYGYSCAKRVAGQNIKKGRKLKSVAIVGAYSVDCHIQVQRFILKLSDGRKIPRYSQLENDQLSVDQYIDFDNFVFYELA